MPQTRSKSSLPSLLSLLLLTISATSLAPSPALAAPITAAAAGPDLADLVERVGPVVVNIRTTEKTGRAGAGGGADAEQMQEFLHRYFGAPPNGAAPGGRTPGFPQQQEDDDTPARRGVGSGFIISADGYVLTNAHVVKDAGGVIVTLGDKREFTAKVVGLDSRTDVALLKIDATGLAVASIGDSSKARVGEWVIAIGSPFDLDNTVTAGIISAKARETGDFLPLLQTDVAVNPGNSGGPLINLRGQVVGINSQIYSRSGGYMGISFAIPIEDAIRVADQLKSSGTVTRGRLGVYLGDVGKEVAASLGLPKAEGSLIGRIEKGGPADLAGLRGGDIILAFNGKEIDNSAALRRLSAAAAPGSEVKLQYWRNGVRKDATLKVATLEAEGGAAVKPEPAGPAPLPINAFGLSLEDLPKGQKDGGGVLVTNAEGSAKRAGLQAGDVIVAINNQDVNSTRQFDAALAKANPAKPLLLLARRGEVTKYLTVQPPSAK
ncbi:MAG: Do family serine endopeptidase [Massilia sp.]